VTLVNKRILQKRLQFTAVNVVEDSVLNTKRFVSFLIVFIFKFHRKIKSEALLCLKFSIMMWGTPMTTVDFCNLNNIRTCFNIARMTLALKHEKKPLYKSSIFK